MRWDNLVSLSVVLLYFVPWIRFFQTGSLSELRAFWGMMATVAVNEGIKHGIIGTDSPRPPGARDCNLWVNDGPQAGRPGAPSGHSAQVSFFVGYYLQTLSLSPLLRFLLLGYALLVMFSRYTKSCHTFPQILSGATLGSLLSILLVRHL
jgi:membrane-associated phospholipid phosphatase